MKRFNKVMEMMGQSLMQLSNEDAGILFKSLLGHVNGDAVSIDGAVGVIFDFFVMESEKVSKPKMPKSPKQLISEERVSDDVQLRTELSEVVKVRKRGGQRGNSNAKKTNSVAPVQVIEEDHLSPDPLPRHELSEECSRNYDPQPLDFFQEFYDYYRGEKRSLREEFNDFVNFTADWNTVAEELLGAIIDANEFIDSGEVESIPMRSWLKQRRFDDYIQSNAFVPQN